ncbi:pilus assembly protein [Delftia sp. PS-11]|uniref:pilus assembly protein n=1 Tax=Delftia sp. PS-11 TaxID=2767222 RepID=UPI00245851ED|nr:PilC/PilY family type IV pilus protein [Delftia sp. PS-11]KAJ8745881.1 pilus assembly protein PilY [Delftia sp. PS-11]
MNHTNPFKTTLLASLAALAWAPAASRAQPLDLAQSPPATVEPYVAPNVILSLDNSGSMNREMTVNGKSSTRLTILKDALRSVFNDKKLLPNGKIRLAWHVMNCCDWNLTGVSLKGPTQLTGNAKNSMRALDNQHRQQFLAFVDEFKASGLTPTHDLMERADAYMRERLGINSPWAAIPGRQAEPYLGCRRNYHVLLTDGGWTGPEIRISPRNYDNADRTLPDGTAYQVSNAQTQLYRDREDYTTIADWAFKSWAEPLQSKARLRGGLRQSAEFRNAPDTETFTNRSRGTSTTLEKYWNPRYNPATWPHMVTFTIGFSEEAMPSYSYDSHFNGSRYPITQPSSVVPYGYDGDFADYAQGTFQWWARGRDKGHDMWHAALNGRGKFYAVNQGEDLAKAFRQIVQQINSASEPERSSAATSGGTVARNPVGLYTAHYDPTKAWKGWITGQSMAPDGTISAAPGWQGKTTADHLDSLSDAGSRTILTWTQEGRTSQGVPFRWDALSAEQKALFNQRADGTTDALGEKRLNYLRGDRSMEGTGSPPRYTDQRPLRQRHSRQGDTVNSRIWYTGAPSAMSALPGYWDFVKTHKDRTPMLYVGGNDGMLHGFSAVDGTEKLAYVPKGITHNLARLTEPAYDDRHRYFVDGSPMTGDIQDGSDWKTLLVGTLGAGGRGYFVLDVTNPANFSESNAASLVVMDKTYEHSRLPDGCGHEDDAHIGHIFAEPVLDDANPQQTSQIVKLNNDRWAVVMGNGYNSPSGTAALLIQYLDGARERLMLHTSWGAGMCTLPHQGNGLSAPRLVDINGDGRPDVAYAGDLKGNLWKFNIASATPNLFPAWHVGFPSSMPGREEPLFRPSQERAITTAPVVRVNGRKATLPTGQGQSQSVPEGMMIAFGTGRNLTASDPDDSTPGAIYAVLDPSRYKVEGSHVRPCAGTSDTSDGCYMPHALQAALWPRTIRESELATLSVDRQSTTEGQQASADRTFWKVSGDGANVGLLEKPGWRFDLPEAGERLLKPLGFFDHSNILAIHSQIPARVPSSSTGAVQESCAIPVANEHQFLTLLNILDGKRPSVQIMDTNGDGLYSAADQGMHRMSIPRGTQSQIIRKDDRIVLQGGDGEQSVLARMPEQPVRPSWRQLQ